MRHLRGNLQALVLVVGVSVACLGVAAAFRELWPLVTMALAVILLIVLTLVTHMHRRVGGTLRAVVRGQRQDERARKGMVRQLQRSGAEAHEGVAATVTAAVQRDFEVAREDTSVRLDALEAIVRGVGRDLRNALGQLAERDRRVGEEIARQSDASLSASQEILDLVHRLHHESVTEIDAMVQVHRRFPLEGPVPLMWGWALSPRALLQVLDIAIDPGVRTIVECGSGTSTIYLGAALRSRPGARVIALEHLDEVADFVEGQVRLHGLEQIVDVRRAALVDVTIRGHRHQWYDLSMIEDLKSIDLALVDGPPAATGPLARFPAFPLLRERLSEGAIIALDDAARPDERLILDRWHSENENLHRLWSMTSNLALLRWQNVGNRL